MFPVPPVCGHCQTPLLGPAAPRLAPRPRPSQDSCRGRLEARGSTPTMIPSHDQTSVESTKHLSGSRSLGWSPVSSACIRAWCLALAAVLVVVVAGLLSYFPVSAPPAASHMENRPAPTSTRLHTPAAAPARRKYSWCGHWPLAGGWRGPNI